MSIALNKTFECLTEQHERQSVHQLVDQGRQAVKIWIKATCEPNAGAESIFT